MKFLAFNALGAALWVGVWVTLGDLASNHITAISNHITAIYDTAYRYQIYLGIAVAVLIIAVLVRHLLSRRSARPTTTRSR